MLLKAAFEMSIWAIFFPQVTIINEKQRLSQFELLGTNAKPIRKKHKIITSYGFEAEKQFNKLVIRKSSRFKDKKEQ